ncbi:MAG: hypothetical protein IE916_03190 [Epsilonproteobacteria bacterium]|nr:hypothetical protein [Campylobacterota bacterium]
MRVAGYISAILISLGVVFGGCTTVSKMQRPLPEVKVQDEDGQKSTAKIALFSLKNYTDTPQAGMRAANLLEGILITKGYSIISHVNEASVEFDKALSTAKKEGAAYFVMGGVSEWRYKTGIDGEPAVSLQITIYDASNGEVLWSATGSDSDWGNESIGTTAHNLIELLVAQ